MPENVHPVKVIQKVGEEILTVKSIPGVSQSE